VFLGNGDGTFQMSSAYPTGRFAEQLIAEDFAGDHSAEML
jgi:hypothetical protein